MVVFVLLVYSEKYYLKAFEEIKKLSSNFKNSQIIIVNNNKDWNLDNSVIGNNESFEFSGWDTAISYMKEILNNKPKYVVFANDTFCHHRSWGLWQKIKFTLAFKSMYMSNKTGICGEKNSIGSQFKLLDQEIDGWISTYLFMVSSDIVFNEKFKFSQAKKNMDRIVLNIDNNSGIKLCEHIDRKFERHINNWLFPTNNKGWYKANNVNIDFKLKKLECILNEKLLTSYVCKVNGRINDVNSFFVFKLVKKFFSFLRD